ncbi:methyl-accepting chemotaxis protein [Halovenus sp. HT40]|uniref:methyl-accepting chemotaxis protein n=1 Tax=Halovenus sp. HT40 TaxID=3126691 RepID=UPI00300F1A9A
MHDRSSAHIDDSDRRTLVNAQGAVQVVRTTSESVDDRLQRLLTRADDQEGELTEVADAVSELSATIEEIAASAEQVDNRSAEAADRVSDGHESATQAMDRMDGIQTTMASVQTELDSLLDQIDEIESALAGITRIAEQTNMLALNASIEAARAGDDSDGFAVVADEIESLAAESQERADEIDAILTDVRSAADATNSELDAALSEVTESTDEVEHALDQLAAVADAVDETASDVSSVSDATDEQARVSQSVMDRCTTAADQATEMTETVRDIDAFRAEQTVMLEEIDGALTEATPTLSVEEIDRIPTGVEPLDDATDGGLLTGGQSVLQHDTNAVDVVATLCGSALAAGYAVSLMPPESMSRSLLADGLDSYDVSLSQALDGNRLFILDMFDEWRGSYNVFDVRSRSLGAVNSETANRRDQPLLIVGNIAGEIAVLGEEAAREARYENDSTVFAPSDTVCNVVDERTVDETFGAFYAGAADQVLELTGADGNREIALRSSPTGSTPPRSLAATSTAVSKLGD